MKQFEVWWAKMPEPIGERPVLLLSRTSAYPYLIRILVVEVTTTVRSIPQEVPLGPREGLPKRCVANLDACRTIPRQALIERISELKAAKHVEIKRAMGHVLHWPELTVL